MEKKRRDGRIYREKKREYKELCDSKRKKENEKWENKVKDARRENEV